MSNAGSSGIERVTARVAAVLLGVSEWTVTRWCRLDLRDGRGRLPGAVKPGQDWQVPLEAVHLRLANPWTQDRSATA